MCNSIVISKYHLLLYSLGGGEDGINTSVLMTRGGYIEREVVVMLLLMMMKGGIAYDKEY